MASSSEVFALRKEGHIDRAYEMAIQVYGNYPHDAWNKKALAYCLCDLIKRSASVKDYELAQSYFSKLSELNLDESDDILQKSIRNAKLLADPRKEIIVRAKQLSFDGNDQEAYSLYVEAIKMFPEDVDLAKNYGWTLYKLLKLAIENKIREQIVNLLEKCKQIEPIIQDEKLLHGIKYLEELSDESRQVIRDAKRNSKEGKHIESLKLFRIAIKTFPDDTDLNEQFAWELYREAKPIFDSDKIDLLKARQLLAEYIRLKNERPSQLHSMFLRLADKIAESEEFNIIAFLKLWGLKNLRDEDFESFHKEGKTYSSIAEKVIQHSAKVLIDKRLKDDVPYFQPHIADAIVRYPENIWLTYYNAKLLHLIGENDKAIGFLTPVIKEKIGEYWVWSLLAELLIATDRDRALSAYCKALLCKGEESFLSNVRAKIIELLIERKFWTEAKHEIESVIKTKSEAGFKVPEIINQYHSLTEIKLANPTKNNVDFYISRKGLAEEIVFESLNWIEACVGEKYVIPDKPDKPRRKIFIKLSKEIIDVSISDRKFNVSKNYKLGDTINVKGEYDKEKNFNLYLLDKRNGNEKWDIFDWHPGVVTYSLKNEKNRITGYRVSMNIHKEIKESVIDVDDDIAKKQFEDGAPVFIKYFIKKKQNPNYPRLMELKIKLLAIKERENSSKWDIFPEHIAVVDHINHEKGMVHFIVDKNIDSIIRINQLNGNVDIGTCLLVKLKNVKKDWKSYYTVLSCSITDSAPPPEVLLPFSGEVELSGNVGFANDVYIENSFIKDLDINSGDNVTGMAILNYNKKKDRWGWKAIKITEHVRAEINYDDINIEDYLNDIDDQSAEEKKGDS